MGLDHLRRHEFRKGNRLLLQNLSSLPEYGRGGNKYFCNCKKLVSRPCEGECKDKDWDGEGTLSFDDGIKLVNEFRRNKPWDAKEFEKDGKIFEEKKWKRKKFWWIEVGCYISLMVLIPIFILNI